VKTTVRWATSSTEAKKSYDAWMTFLDEFNSDSDASGSSENSWLGARPQVRMTGDIWIRMATEIAAVEGTKLAILIATSFAVGAIVVFTGNLVVALLALISLIAIVVTVLAVFTLSGWTLGIVEAISITILVGLSCDFSLHLAEAYSHSSFHGRGNRGKDAVARVGSPIVAAGITTFLAIIPMLGCTIQVLSKFGAIIPVCIVLSLFYSLHLFTPLLMTFGPSGNLRGLLRGLPSVLFRTQARRVMFMFCAAVLLCLVIPSMLAIVRESLVVFIVSVLVIAALIAAWIKVEKSREEQGVVEDDPTVQESRFNREMGGGGDHREAEAPEYRRGPVKLFTSARSSDPDGFFGAPAAHYLGNSVTQSPPESGGRGGGRGRGRGSGRRPDATADGGETEFRALAVMDSSAH